MLNVNRSTKSTFTFNALLKNLLYIVSTLRFARLVRVFLWLKYDNQFQNIFNAINYRLGVSVYRCILIDQLQQQEGLRLKIYDDGHGNRTIGFGRNLDAKGITQDEALHMLNNDIDEVEAGLNKIDIYKRLPQTQQTVLCNMAFNLGITGLLGFRRMWHALERHDYSDAADEMLRSKWAGQVGRRATDLAEIMRSCKKWGS